MEQTLVLVKPDGVKRGLVGEVIGRFERRGLTLSGLKMMTLTEKQAKEHYAEHQDKSFFRELISFITSGPVVAMVISGPKAVKVVRMMMGTTNPVDSQPGTIRGDLATEMACNVIHGSDSSESAKREISIYFTEQEVVF